MHRTTARLWLLCYYSPDICPPHWIFLYRTIQVGRDFRRSLVLPAAQSKATCRVRTVDLEKLPRKENAQPAALLDCGVKGYYLCPTSLFNLCPFFLNLPPCMTVESLDHSLWPYDAEGWSEVPQEHFTSSEWTRPTPSAPPHRVKCSSPQTLGWPLLDLLWLANVHPIQRSPDWKPQHGVVGWEELFLLIWWPSSHSHSW